MKVDVVMKEVARKLRKNMTESEVIIWNILKEKGIGVNFLRQKPVYVFTDLNGKDRYIIPDFYCYEKKVILEIDGSIHNLKEVYELDLYKQELLENMSYTIIRIKNEDIKNNLTEVIRNIKDHL